MLEGFVVLLPLLSEYRDAGSGSMAHCLSTSPVSSVPASRRLGELVFVLSSIPSASCCRKGTQHTTCVSKILDFSVN